MPDVLEAWKAKGVHEVTLESDGVTLGLKLPNKRACLISGGVPLDVVDKMEKIAGATNGDAPTLTLEDLEYDTKWQAEMICQMVKTVEGEPITLTHEDVAELGEDVRTELWLYATRQKPLDPKAT